MFPFRSSVKPNAGFLYKLLIVLFIAELPQSFLQISTPYISNRTITTRYGKMKGLLKKSDDKRLSDVEAYLGIKYASLNHGTAPLRWFQPSRSPNEQADWVKMFIKFKPVCPQLVPDVKKLRTSKSPDYLGRLSKTFNSVVTHQIEDCLNLNIYVPVRGATEATANNLFPVLVFIHDHDLRTGTGNVYDGRIMAAFGKMAVLTLNYRVGVFGFLSAGKVKGNQALFDILSALKWTSENIEPFGGDKNRVTIMGHGQGAALVGHLASSSSVRELDLFQRAIMMSGSPESSWSRGLDAGDEYTRSMLQYLNCTATNQHKRSSKRSGSGTKREGDIYENFLRCLNQSSLDGILRAAEKVDLSNLKYRSVLASLAQAEPLGLDVDRSNCVNSTTRPVDIIIGVTRHESSSYFNYRELDHGLSAARMQKIMRTFVQNVFVYHKQKVFEILTNSYRDWDRPPGDPEAIRDASIEFLDDALFNAPVVAFLKRLLWSCFESRSKDCFNNDTSCSSTSSSSSSSSPTTSDTQSDPVNRKRADRHASVYFYVFESSSIGDSFNTIKGHGHELDFVFGHPLVNTSRHVTDRNRLLSERVMTYWTNFVHTGNPNKKEVVTFQEVYGTETEDYSVISNPVWTEYEPTQQLYMLLYLTRGLYGNGDSGNTADFVVIPRK